jgi:predicted MPP superfamily phosphohydrolase
MAIPKSRRKRRIKIVLLTVAALAAAALIWGFAVEPRLLTVTETEFADARLPEDMDGVRIAFIADVHAGPNYPPQAVERLVQKIEGLDPDMLLFGGDMLAHEDTALALDAERVARAFAALKPRLGKYAVYGNHDIWTPTMKNIAREILEDGGFTVLENSAAEVEGGFYVAGTAPWPTGGKNDPANRSDVRQVAWTARGDAFSLLLAHEPAQIEDGAKFPFALQLSGHTHGGQIALPFVGPLLLPGGSGKYGAGFFKVNDTAMYVTRGVGTSIIPARFLVPPEIVIITLRRK